ncbi:hypothetical protein HXX76_012379 [Chlamydomonas incerta]|uniref:Uncharacterized protein n=1 Tax=Chlamydomonas incerta TaxID=51695 RepID=A0A835SPN9_CHLIN|nr:hypothetical protein HXX76_012379 [Chlamydomonas incerta]|eukprot:KAG2427443.1 hypothetical protein HXX76_012379 [Chlamydomonas incerta]
MSSHSVARVQDMLGQWAPSERASTAPAASGGSERFRRHGLLGSRGRGGASLRTTVTEEVKDAAASEEPEDGAASGGSVAGGGVSRSPSPTGRLGRQPQPQQQRRRPASRVPNHPSFLTGAEKRAHLEAAKAEQSGRPVWRPGGGDLVGWSSLRQRDA